MASEENSALWRIVLTRVSGRNESLRRELVNALGAQAEIVELPCVEFCEPEDCSALDSSIRAIRDFAWILFTSQNAVLYFARRMRALGVLPAAAASLRPRIATIGGATAKAASDAGFSVDFASAAGNGKAFAIHFRESAGNVAAMRILAPRSDLALRAAVSDDWTEVLRQAGAEVTCVETYQTRAPEDLAKRLVEALAKGADCCVFASPSALENFVRVVDANNMKHLAHRSAFAAIGRTTAAAIRAAGFVCAVEAAEPDEKLLAQAVASYLKGMSHRSNPHDSPHQGANWA